MPADLSKEAIISYIKTTLDKVSVCKGINARLDYALDLFIYIHTYFPHVEEKLGHKFLKTGVMGKAREFVNFADPRVVDEQKRERLVDISIQLIGRINSLDHPQAVG